MRLYKRVLLLVLVLAMSVSLLTGCSTKESSEQTAAETPKPTETVKPTATPTPTPSPTPTPTPTPEVLDESFQVEVSDYFFRCADIVDVFPEDACRESWVHELGWQYQGFWFGYEDNPYSGRIFSMKNEKPNWVTLYGGRVGEHYSDFEQGLIAAGWKPAYLGDNLREYGIKTQGKKFLLDIRIDEDGVVTNWFLGDWPQGDYVEFYAQFDD